MPTRNINSDLKVNADLTLPSLSTYSGSDVTALMIAGADVVGKRALGTNAFNSTSFLPLAGGTLTGDLFLDDGSGATPSLYFKNGDDNFWRFLMESGGNFSVKEGTSARLTFKAGGNVGIGTTSPAEKLTVIGDILIDNGGNSTLYLGKGAEGVDGVTKIKAIQTGTDTDQLGIAFNVHPNTAGSAVSEEAMRIDHAGNVGIGTTSPNAKLELVGKQMITTGANASPQTEDYLYIGGDGLAGADAAIYIGNRGNGSGYGWRMFYEGTGSGNNNKLKFKSENLGSPVDVITMLQDGNVGIGTDSPNALLHVSHATAPTFRLSRTGTGQIWQQSIDSSGRLLINEAASEGGTQYTRLAIDDDGNVGIGTGSPNVKLHVESADQNVARIERTSGSGYTVFDIKDGVGTTGNSIITFSDTAASNGSINYEHADDSMRFTTNASEAMRINSAGNVGIGTTNPSSKLHVGDGTADDFIKVFYSDNTNLDIHGYGIEFNRSVNYLRPTTNANKTLMVGGGARNFNNIHFYSSGVTAFHNASDELVRITAAGNVGIGTTIPTDILTINQTADSSGIRINGYDDVTSSYLKMFVDNNGRSRITQNTGGSTGYLFLEAENYLELVAGTFVYTQDEFRIYDAGQLSLGNGADFKIKYDNSTDKLKIHSSSNDGITMDTSGNVGIGTTSPSSKLHVQGAILVRVNAHDQNSNPDSTTNPSTTTPEFMRIGHTGTYSDGRYTHEWVKLDRGGNLPLYLRQSKGTANSFENIARFGEHSYSTHRFEVFGSIGATALTSSGKLLLNSANYNDHLSLRRGIYGYDTIVTGTRIDYSPTADTNTFKFLADVKTSSNITADGGVFYGGNSTKLDINQYNAGYLRLLTGNAERVRVTSSGNVGIGTDTPSDQDLSINVPRLHVVGPSTTGAFNLVARFQGGNDNDNTGAAILINHSNDRGLLINAGRADSDREVAYFNLVSSGANITNMLTLKKVGSAYNVGIGTTSPTTKFHIDDDASTGTGLLVTGGGVGQALATFTRDVGGSGTIVINSSDSRPQIKLAASSNTFALGVNGSTFEIADNSKLGANARLSITNTGNVGIGTTSPNAKLEVAATATTSVDIAHFSNSNGVVKINHSLDGVGSGIISILDASNNEDVRLSAQGNSWFNAGNVGIGTVSPSYKLDVDSGAVNDARIRVKTGDSNAGAYFQARSGYDGFYGLELFHQSTPKWYIGGYGVNRLGFFAGSKTTSTNEKMSLTTAGNLGIGTTSPASKLQIDQYTVGSNGSQNTFGNVSIFTNSGSDALYLGVKNASYPNRGYSFKITESGVNSDFTIKEHGLSGDRFTIKSGGNVGIGTTSPDAKLEIEQSVTGVPSNDNTNLKLTDTTASYAADVGGSILFSGIYNSSGSVLGQPPYIKASKTNGNNSDYGFGLRFGVRASGSGGSNVAMTIADSGNVGIGTTSPEANLHILKDSANGQAYERLIIDGHSQSTFVSGSSQAITFKGSGNAYAGAVGSYGNGTVGGIGVWGGSTNSGSPDVFVKSGNVGVGITDPDTELEVGGTIKASTHADAIVIGSPTTVKWKMGVYGANDLLIRDASNNTKFSILEGGNVGIGTTSPAQRLHVSGGHILLDNNQQVRFKDSGGTERTIVQLDSSNDLSVGGSYAGALKFIGGGSYTEQMRIHDDGNVGIGETAPEVKLEVAGDIMAKDSFVSAGATASQGYIFHDFGTGWGYKGVQSPSRLGMFTASAERVTIDSDGKVGIGTTSPSQKLHVEGNIELQSAWQIGSNTGSYWQRIRTEDATPSTTNAFNFETRNGSGSFIKHVVIRNDGNVGVGNATPAAKLAVEGTIAHKVYTVATLPSASPAGQRAFVSDSSYSVSDAHGLVTVGSGSNFCPMYSDGTNWRVG